MATCKDCFHYEACSGFMPTDLDKDVWHYCKLGIPEEIPDIDRRCDSFKDSKSWAEVVRCKDCVEGIRIAKCDYDYVVCRRSGLLNTPNDFCSYGEREDNG